jgi:hypothetical protein
MKRGKTAAMPSFLDRHAQEETLEQYSMGRLSEAEVGPFEEHLLICPVCQDRLEETDAFVQAARLTTQKLRAEPLPVREHWWRRLALGLPRPAWISVVVGTALLVVVVAGTRGIFRTATAPPVSVMLESVRGIEGPGNARVPAGKPLVLLIDSTELPQFPTYHLELVDARGNSVLKSSAGPIHQRVSFSAPRLAKGRYWVRLYDPSPRKELLREFGLEAE